MVEALLEKQKQEAINLVQTLPLPSFIYGQGMGANVSEIDFNTFFDTIGDNSIICNEQSKITAPVCVIVKNLSDMDKEFIKKYSQNLVSPKENKILASLFTSPQNTQVIIVPSNTKFGVPINITLHGTEKIVNQNIIIVVESGAHATIIEEATSTVDNLYQNQTIQLYVHENAVVTYNTIQNCGLQTYRFTSKRASVKKDACVRFVDALSGAKYNQLLIQTNLEGERANAQMFTVYYGTKDQLFDIDTQTYHLCSNTSGSMNAKGALHDASRILYRGNIYVQKGAKESVSHQKMNALLLSQNARCDAVPILDVNNDIVTCSHGAAIGQVDKNELFYLQSRGLSKKRSEQIIVEGMLNPFIEKISDIHAQEKVKNIFIQKMQGVGLE